MRLTILLVVATLLLVLGIKATTVIALDIINNGSFGTATS